MTLTGPPVSVTVDDQLSPALEGMETVVGERVLQAPQSVDAGWLSRKFLAGCFGGALIFIGLTYAFVASGSGVDLLLRVVAHAGWFPAKWYVIAVGLDLLFVLICFGFIQADKVFDLIREALPILKAKYGIGPKA